MELQWKPQIEKKDIPLYLAIVEALGADISSGKLPSEARLPTHRELADELGVAVGTVTKAYVEAERRGLIRSEGRRGTIVGQSRRERTKLSLLTGTGTPAIDLGKNHPPHNVDPDLSAVLRGIARRPESRQLLQYSPSRGLPHHRAAGARWISGLGMQTDADSVIVTAGAQHAILVLFAALVNPGDVVVAESHTYPGVMAAGEMLGLHLLAIACDDDGILPDAFESICRQRKVRLLYCNPTLQNPTNVTIPAERRAEIAAVAERHGVYIVEDEIFRPLTTEPPPLISSILPERSCLIVSSSKSIAAGLRVGFVVAPSSLQRTILESLQTSLLSVPPLPVEILATWIDDGTAEKTIVRRRQELSQRQSLAQELLCGFDARAGYSSCHVWLKLPENWTGMEFAMEAQKKGVTVVPAEVFAIDRKSSVDAVRVSVGGVADTETLRAGLQILAGVLRGKTRQDITTV